MADFGEYLPTDVVLAGAKTPARAQQVAGLLAEVNKAAIERAARVMRSSFSCVPMCPEPCFMPDDVAGPECGLVADDGLPSVLTATLSLAMSGMGLNHSDIGATPHSTA
jgi:alpha-glucosidase